MIRIQKEDFSIEQEILSLRKPYGNTGGVVVFIGTARDVSRGCEISGLEFEHYAGMAEKSLEYIRERALKEFDILDAGIVHRVGRIEITENIVLIVVIAEHRKEAFKACEFLIDELKKTTPIWKKEFTAKGEVWVAEHP